MKYVIALIALALAGCSQQAPRFTRTQIDRALQGAPGAAQPGQIVAVEKAFARAARDEGQWTAFAEYAAPGAILHGRGGGIAAAGWLSAQSDPAEAVQWAPRAVWMSCDGSLAVSQGRFLDPDGKVGTFVTVWQQQPDRSYKWVYDVGAPDNPQPPAPPPEAPRGEFDIVVTGIDSIEGRTADCARAGEDVAAMPQALAAARSTNPEYSSRDGTLSYTWAHSQTGERHFVATWLRDGEWQTELDQRFAPATSN